MAFKKCSQIEIKSIHWVSIYRDISIIFDNSRYIDTFDISRFIDTFWHFEIYRYFFDISRKIRELSICKTRKAECNNRQNVFWWLKHYIQKRNGLSNLFTMTLAHFKKRKTQFPGKSFSPERNGMDFVLISCAYFWKRKFDIKCIRCRKLYLLKQSGLSYSCFESLSYVQSVKVKLTALRIQLFVLPFVGR